MASMEEIKRFVAEKKAPYEASGEVAAAEQEILKTLVNEGYDKFLRVIFDEKGEPAFNYACSNMRVAVSHAMAAKIKIAEEALGVELGGDFRVAESSRMSQMETAEEKAIQLGIILRAMRDNPRDNNDVWNDIITAEARRAVGSDAKTWAAEMADRTNVKSGAERD